MWDKKEEWERYPPDLRPPAEKVIQDLINRLIDLLYIPDADGLVVDNERLKKLVGDPGPVNWGDLRCTHVERRGTVYVAYVEEAAPEARPLQQYLERWLQKWGWPVVVITEW